MVFVTSTPVKNLVFMKKLILYCSVAMATLIVCCKKNKSDDTDNTPVNLKDSVLVSNLTLPWEILWGPDNHIWVTERGGKISRVNPTTGAITPLLTIADVRAQGEGGLLGMVLHPDFNSTPQVFVAYNYQSGADYMEKVVRYTYSSGALTNATIIMDGIKGSINHNGCRLLIVDQKLFISTGDAEDQPLAQNINSRNGKILRVNLDGSIPADNPIANNPLWSMGHRNPQGLVYAKNRLYSSEHGPSSDDEINIIDKNRNYGWPNVNGLCDANNEKTFCTANNVMEPIQTWTPTIAPSGMVYYDKNLIPQFKNSLLLATLKNSRLVQLQLNDAGTAVDSVAEFYASKYGRMRDLCISPDGKVYICTSNGNNDKIVVVSAVK
jgi:aldose sugar dehydrogenase